MNIEYYQSQKKHMWKKTLLSVFICITTVFCIYTFYQLVINNNLLLDEFITPITQKDELEHMTQPSITQAPSQIDMNSIEQIVKDSLAEASGDYAVSIINLTNGESYGTNEHQTFLTASIYKLWVMAETYKQIKENILTNDQILSQDIAVLNRKFQIDPAYAEQTSGAITETIDDALKKMITISHNYAAMLLTEKVRLSNVADLLSEYGFKESKIGDAVSLPITTAYDTALFLETLYKGRLIDEDASKKMMELLKDQQLNEKLPKYLPKKTIIAHKTGELDQFSHDAGIVFTDHGDYIIVVLTETTNPQQANEVIARLSENIYQYVSNMKE
jgi:beta-lactamase class A